MNAPLPVNVPAARQQGRLITAVEFFRDAAALAARLPARRHIVNLCSDRYRFCTGLAAALLRRQVSLMPASTLPATLTALAEDYPDLYLLTDSPPPNPSGDLPSLRYPADLAADLFAPPQANPVQNIPDDQPAVILFTSGSTGKPKPVPKNWGTLRASALTAGARLGIKNLRGASIIATVPHHHSYGLESIILLGLLHGLTIESGWPLYPADINAALAAAPRPRILVTTPVHLRALLAEPEAVQPADLILSATAPLPADLAAAAEAAFGAKLIEIYGCTEAGQIATRRPVSTPEWQCFGGITLHQDGSKTWAEGPAIPGPTPLHDSITLLRDQKFQLGARAEDLVDVAGKRASLTALTASLLATDGVQDGVFLMGAPRGFQVARLAAIAVAPGHSQASLLSALRQRIDPAFLPRPLVLVEHLPRNALGKLPRDLLLPLLAQAAP